MKKCVTIANQKEIFEFEQTAPLTDETGARAPDGSFKRYLEFDYDSLLTSQSFQQELSQISFQDSSLPEHQEISQQILKCIETGQPLPQGVYDISSTDISSFNQYGGRPFPKTRLNPMVITHWHLKQDMKIYQGAHLHSSRIRSIEGNVICTESGSYYLLAGRDPAIRKVQTLIAPKGSPNDVYNSLNPLSPKSIIQLLFAEKIVYGEGKESAGKLLYSLEGTESLFTSSGLSDMTRVPFETIKEILKTLGITPETVDLVEGFSELRPNLIPSPLRPPRLILIHYSLVRGGDVFNGIPFHVFDNIPIREFFLRILFTHMNLFYELFQQPEPFDGNLRLEWSQALSQIQQFQGIEGSLGDGEVINGWTPNDPTENYETNWKFGETPLSKLFFSQEMTCRVLFRNSLG